MELKKLENSSVELVLTLQADKIEEAYSKAIKDYAKKLTIKGFRPGKAPIPVVESKYGSQIREESTFRLMEEFLKESYNTLDKKEQPLPYSTPVLQNEESLLPFKPNTDITYSVIYDVVPQFTLPQHTGLTIAARQTHVTDEEVDREIEALRNQNAMVVSKDGEIAEGDIVTLDYAELSEDGTVLEATKREDFTFTVGSSYNFYKLDRDIIGMKRSDERVIEKTYGDDSGMGTDYLGRTVKISVKIKEVKYRDIPALDDDFAQDVKEEYKTVDDLKRGTRAHLEEHAESDNRAYKLDAVVKDIMSRVEIPVPASMLEAELDSQWRQFVSRFGGMKEADVERFMSLNGGGGKEEFMNTNRTACLENLKGQLIIEAVKEEQKAEPTAEEISEAIKNYGENITEDSPNYDVIKMYAEDDVKYRKAQDYLLENNTFVEKTDEPKTEGEASTDAPADGEQKSDQ